MPASWKALYESPVASVWLLVVLPALFLGALAVRRFAPGPGVEPFAARWVRWWAVVFGVATIVDPIATGPLKLPLLPFVLLGDYRVFALLLPVMEPGRSRPGLLLEAAAWTLPVPVIAYGAYRGAALVVGEPPETTLWIAYEVAFAAVAAFMMARVLPRRVGIERPEVRRYVRAVLAFVIAYYVLWAACDVIVLTGREWGWGLRVVPNLLYYGVFVPFAYRRFFGRV